MYLLVFQWLIGVMLLSGTGLIKKNVEWKHKKQFFGHIQSSLVDKNGDLLINFFNDGLYQISKDSCQQISKFGEGPSEWTNSVWGLCLYQEGFAMRESSGRTQIFMPGPMRYEYDKTIWINPSTSFLGTGLFYLDHRFYLIGMDMNWTSKTDRVSRLKVFEEKPRKEIASYIDEKYLGPSRLYQTTLYLGAYKNKIIAVKETELVLHEITQDTLNQKSIIYLTEPDCYRKKPSDFYKLKKYSENREYLKDLERWSISYSAVTKTAIVGDKLIVQIRTFDAMKMKFALLVYEIDQHYQLNKVIPINDLLLGGKDEVLYFFKNGSPYLDDEVDSLAVTFYLLQ